MALLAALLVGLAVFVWVESYSSSFQNCVSQEGTKPASNQSAEQKNPLAVIARSYARCTERFADRHNSFITALATILLAVITLGLILGGIDQQRTTRAQSRAYLMSVVGSQFRQGGVRGLKFEFRPVVLNTGQTPAYDVQVASKILFLSSDEAAAFDFRLPRARGASVMTLGPRQDRFIHTIFDRTLSKAELREYKKNNKRLYVFGTLFYRDAFRARRYTHFCYSINWWSKRGPPLWHSVHRHNDSN
jgi:hypothetical protein